MQVGCKLPSRHGHITWFGSNAYVHGTPRLFRSPSCTRPPGAPASKAKCPQDTESRAPPPSLSVTQPKTTMEFLHQGGGLLFPRTKCRHRSTPSRRVIDGNALLASARLLLSYLSQELSLYKCTKHSL